MQTQAKRPTLLIVDDEPVLLEVLSRGAQRTYEVTTATSGREALEAIRAGLVPDVILSDVFMPDIDGLEFLQILRGEMPALAERVVLMTGDRSPELIAALEELDLKTQVLEKPFHPNRLASLLPS